MGLTYINLESLMEMLLGELETGEDDLVSLRCYEARLAEPFVRAFRSGDRKGVERLYSEMLKEQ